MAFTGADTIDTLSRGRSNCRPALSSVSLMFSGFFSLFLTDCLTSWLMLIYCLEFAPSLPCNMSVALCSCCLLYSLYPRSWFHLPPVSFGAVGGEAVLGLLTSNLGTTLGRWGKHLGLPKKTSPLEEKRKAPVKLPTGMSEYL